MIYFGGRLCLFLEIFRLSFLAKALFLFFLFLSVSAHAFESPGIKVVSWGSGKNQGFYGYRIGCAKDVDSCVSRVVRYSSYGSELISVSLSWSDLDIGDYEAMVDGYVESIGGLGHKIEFSIDDFSDYLKKYGDAGIRVLRKIIKNKSDRSGYGVGLTLYEDSIDDVLLYLDGFPDVKIGVNRVSLYLHYRSNFIDLNKYVSLVKSAFPGASVYLGVYHYDRIDYISCYEGSTSKCSSFQEIEYFNEALSSQKRLVSDRVVSGLELYPGFLGNEEGWGGWNIKKICLPARVDECVVNSKEMGGLLMKLLNSGGL